MTRNVFFLITVLACLVFHVFSVRAEKPLSDQDATLYYRDCIDDPSNAALDKDVRDSLCSCAASRYIQEMSMEDVLVINANRPEATQARHKLLLEVLTPCLEIPVSDILEKECLTSSAFNLMPKEKKLDICLCSSYAISEEMSSVGKEFVRQKLKNEPDFKNPLLSFVNSPVFEQISRQVIRDCVEDYN